MEWIHHSYSSEMQASFWAHSSGICSGNVIFNLRTLKSISLKGMELDVLITEMFAPGPEARGIYNSTN